VELDDNVFRILVTIKPFSKHRKLGRTKRSLNGAHIGLLRKPAAKAHLLFPGGAPTDEEPLRHAEAVYS
jgi:hypothetical protein